MKKILIIFCIIFSIVSYSSAFNIIITGGSVPESASLSTPTYNATAGYQSGTTNFGTTCTVSLTTQDASDRAFIFFFAWTGVNSISTVTFDGNAMTQIATVTGVHKAAMYSYVDAGSADYTGAKSLVVTLDGSTSQACWAVEIDGVNASSLVQVSDTTTAAGADPQKITNTVDTTGQDNCLLVSGVKTEDGGTDPIHSVCDSTGQTLWSDITEQGSVTINGGYFDMSSAGSKDQCFQSDQTFNTQESITAALKPSGS